MISITTTAYYYVFFGKIFLLVSFFLSFFLFSAVEDRTPTKRGTLVIIMLQLIIVVLPSVLLVLPLDDVGVVLSNLIISTDNMIYLLVQLRPDGN
jgi:hypothetical protein